MKEIRFILTITAILAVLFILVNSYYITSTIWRKVRSIVAWILFSLMAINLMYCIIKAVGILIGNVEL